MRMKSLRVTAVALAISIGGLALSAHSQDIKKPLEKVRLTVPAKSLTFIPYYFGKAHRLYEKEGIDLELIVMRPPIGVTALQAGEVDYSAAGGLSARAAMKGLPLRTIMFIQTRLSFSGIGSLAHYAAITVMKRLGNEKVAYISTNTTPNSYTALLGKATDAAILTPPYTFYGDSGWLFRSRKYFRRARSAGRPGHENTSLHDHREQVKSMIRATLRSMD